MRPMASVRPAHVPSASPSASRSRRTTRLAASISGLAALVCAVATSPAAQAMPALGTAQRAAVTAETTSTNGVINPSAVVNTAGWTAGSSAGSIRVSRSRFSSGPNGLTSGIGFQRAGGTGSWASAMTPLRNPATFFTVGKTYRMQAWVRDWGHSSRSLGILLANNHYTHRPTEVTAYGAFGDTKWHLLTKTFVASSTGYSDTMFYVALPTSGALDWQITGASVQAVSVPQPTSVSGTPATQVLGFGGAAGSAPYSGQWTVETGGNGWGNGQQETYTSRSSNVALDGSGHLKLTVRRETYKGSDGYTRSFTSGRVTTKNKINIAPGSYVESAIKAPVGSAVWPAFWTMGSNVGTVGWPASGELDILEVSGSKPTLAHTAIHMNALSDTSKDVQYGWGESGGTVDLHESLDYRAHTYGVYFDGNTVRYYIDRKLTRAVWATDAAAVGRAWPYGKAQYLILNIAIDGRGDPSGTSFPRTMTIGSVAIWKGGVPF